MFGFVFYVHCLGALVAGELVDLTHNNDENAPTHPLNKHFKMTITHDGFWEHDPTIWLQNDEFFMPSHSGTHIDAPVHFRQGGKTIDEIPPEKFVGPAVVVDHSARCLLDKNDVLRVSDLKEWEAKYGRIPVGSMVLSLNGWSKYVRDKAKYYGSPNPENWLTTGMNFPGFSKQAAEWLVRERQIYGVGTEALSIDPGNTTTFSAHQIFAAADVLMIENVGTGIHKIPHSGATLLFLPMKNKGASGAPIRMLAYWGDDVHRFANIASGTGIRSFSATLGIIVSILLFCLP